MSLVPAPVNGEPSLMVACTRSCKSSVCVSAVSLFAVGPLRVCVSADTVACEPVSGCLSGLPFFMRAARAGARPRPSRASVAGARARDGGGRAPPSAAAAVCADSCVAPRGLVTRDWRRPHATAAHGVISISAYNYKE